MPAASAAPAAVAAEEPVEVSPASPRLWDAPLNHVLQEKPKEKTIFNVKLESFAATAKPKIIREVKAMIPNLTLIDVCPASLPTSRICYLQVAFD